MASRLWSGQRHKLTFCHHHHQCRLRELECKESREQTLRLSEPLQDAQVAVRSYLENRARSDPCRVRIEECLKTTPEGAVREEERKSEVQQES